MPEPITVPPAVDYAIGVAHLGRRHPPKPSPGHIAWLIAIEHWPGHQLLTECTVHHWDGYTADDLAREWIKRSKDAHWHVTSKGRRHLTIHVADGRTIHRRFTDANPTEGELT